MLRHSFVSLRNWKIALFRFRSSSPTGLRNSLEGSRSKTLEASADRSMFLNRVVSANQPVPTCQNWPPGFR